jgi:predicted lysophospholipase L1 biosynthesis ABC-type transport system permease subunit
MGLAPCSLSRTVPAVPVLWIVALALAAVFAGWAQATYLRRATPTRRVPMFRWGITPRGGPVWVIWLGALASMASLLALLRLARNDLTLATALMVGCTAIALLVKAVVLRRHNEQVGQRP